MDTTRVTEQRNRILYFEELRNFVSLSYFIVGRSALAFIFFVLAHRDEDDFSLRYRGRRSVLTVHFWVIL